MCMLSNAKGAVFARLGVSRRMADCAAHLVENVLPLAPYVGHGRLMLLVMKRFRFKFRFRGPMWPTGSSR